MVHRAHLAAPVMAEPPPDEEAQFILRSQADRRAFAPLYARYLSPVYRYCYRRLGQREAAEDATSRTFARALAALPTFRQGNFAGWLFAIAHHVVADDLRRRRPEVPLELVRDPVAALPSPEEAVLAAEDRGALRALLDQLSPEQREVVELRLVGLTGAEIAQALGRSVGSVKMLQLRGVARLRQLLGTGTPQEGG